MARRKKVNSKTAMIALLVAVIIIGVGYFTVTAYIGIQDLPVVGGEFEWGPTDETPPTWSNQQQSADTAGPEQTITLSADWSDDTALASAQLFVTTDTDNWPISEEMTVALSGNSSTSTFVYVVPDVYASGTTIYWKIKGLDGTGNENETDVMSFTVQDLNIPTCKLESDKTEVKEGEKVNLTATCIDENGPISVKFFDDYTNQETDSQSIDSGDVASYIFDTSGVSAGTVVNWKVIVSDALGNEGESDLKSFTIVEYVTTDTEEPLITISEYEPLTIRTGDTVTITVEATDNEELASATLLIDGEEIDTITLDGTSDTATFSWLAPEEDSYTWMVKIADSAGNTVETASLTFLVKAQPEQVIQCPVEAKPLPGPWGDCIEGKQSRTVYKCDTTIGTWTILDTEEQDCAAPELDTTALIPIILIIIVVVVAVIAAMVMRRKPKAKAAAPAAPPAPPQG